MYTDSVWSLEEVDEQMKWNTEDNSLGTGRAQTAANAKSLTIAVESQCTQLGQCTLNLQCSVSRHQRDNKRLEHDSILIDQ